MLIDAATTIWQEQGWAAVTMRGVCSRARLTDRYFYESFEDRDALLGVVWDRVRDDVVTHLASAVTAAGASPSEQMYAAIGAITRVVADDPPSALILFGDHAGSEVLESRRRSTIQQVTEMFVLLASTHLREGADVKALRVHTLAGIGGFVEIVLAWRSGALDLTRDELYAHAVRIGDDLAPRFVTPWP